MSFKTAMKTKYCTLNVHEDVSSGGEIHYWASIGMAWAEKHDERSKMFAITMDERLLQLARNHLVEGVDNVNRDIYLEDGDLMVILLNYKKHQAAKLIGIISKVENEFDLLTNALE